MYNSFKHKVNLFWKAFEEDESTIREMMNNNVEGEALLSFTESILKIAFTEIQFQMGVTLDNKYELTLTPQGDRTRLIQYNYWLDHCPESLSKNWVFHTSKPALQHTEYSVSLFGITLEDKDIILYPNINHQASKIELDVYSPKLDAIPDSQRYSIFFIFLDQHISELYTIEHVSNIQFVYEKKDTKSIDINSLKKFIDSTIQTYGWTNSSNPLDGYLGYKVQQTDRQNWILREDVSAGYSSCTAPISAYHFKDDSFFNKFKKDGVTFGFVFFENIDIADEEVVEFRAKIEDKIIEQTTDYGISNCIGGATGFHFSYIDFIIYDFNAFAKIIKDVMSNYSFEEVGFSYFLSGSEPIMLAEISNIN